MFQVDVSLSFRCFWRACGCLMADSFSPGTSCHPSTSATSASWAQVFCFENHRMNWPKGSWSQAFPVHLVTSLHFICHLLAQWYDLTIFEHDTGKSSPFRNFQLNLGLCHCHSPCTKQWGMLMHLEHMEELRQIRCRLQRRKTGTDFRFLEVMTAYNPIISYILLLLINGHFKHIVDFPTTRHKM